MATVNEIFGTGVKQEDSNQMLLGIEVELEHVNELPERQLKYWTITNDGSLQHNGKEFVSGILTYEMNHKQALHHLQQEIDKHNYQASFRCGVHVHVNVGHYTPEELYNLYVVYLAYENLIFQYVANARSQSVFCVPLQSTDFPIQIKEQLKKGRECLDVLLRFTSKYSALNLAPITRHGTVEFRHLYGTTDMAKVAEWIGIIHRLVQLAKEPNVISELCTVNYTSEYGLWIRKVFPEVQELLATDEEHASKLLRTGVRFAKQVS